MNAGDCFVVSVGVGGEGDACRGREAGDGGGEEGEEDVLKGW